MKNKLMVLLCGSWSYVLRMDSLCSDPVTTLYKTQAVKGAYSLSFFKLRFPNHEFKLSK